VQVEADAHAGGQRCAQVSVQIDLAFEVGLKESHVPWPSTSNSGQIRTAGTRLLVQRQIQVECVARLGEFSKSLRVGNGLDPQVQLGSLISRKQLDRVLQYVDIGGKEGAKLVGGGKQLQGELAGGYFIEPTIFTDVCNDMRIARVKESVQKCGRL
jgi:acyl-CoA reductase-like NAD-dependent aldehyde dehydrogenase